MSLKEYEQRLAREVMENLRRETERLFYGVTAEDIEEQAASRTPPHYYYVIHHPSVSEADALDGVLRLIEIERDTLPKNLQIRGFKANKFIQPNNIVLVAAKELDRWLG